MVPNFEGEKTAFSRIISVERAFSDRKTVAVYFPEHIGANYGETNTEKFLHSQG